MPLTNESFRDPRKQYFVKATSGFFLEGREPVNVGEVVSVSRSVAAELVHGRKAVRVVETPPPAVPAQPDPIATVAKSAAKEK